jgi:uncharacterized delta-60 repeat protein
LDPSFDCGSGATNGLYQDVVRSVVELPGGQLLVAGSFSGFNGLPRHGLTRLNPDGSSDPGWPDVLAAGDVNDVLLLAGGGFLIAGDLVLPGRPDHTGLVRLRADGTLDATFSSSLPPRDVYWVKGIQRVVQLADGSLLAGGIGSRYQVSNPFTWSAAPEARGVIHVLPDGTVDQSFKVAFGISTSDEESFAAVSAMKVDAEGRILVGGIFSQFEHADSTSLLRLNPDGSRDTSFAANLDYWITGLAIQNDGKILVACGVWTGSPPSSIVRLLPDGSLDPTFQAPVSSNRGWAGEPALAVQEDGRILISGNFDSVNGALAHNLARLNPDGSLDSNFTAGEGLAPAASGVGTLTLLRDGKIMAGGLFESFDGLRRRSLVRLGGGDHSPGPPSARVNPASQLIHPGLEASFVAYMNSASARRYQWLHENQGIPGATNQVLSLANVLPQQAGNYSVSVSDSVGTGTSAPVRLEVWPIDRTPGSFDPVFFTGSGPDGAVRAAARLPTGKLVIGGDFQQYDGLPHPHLARLQADGSLDTEYDLLPDGPVESIIPLQSGAFLVSGSFTSLKGLPCPGLARLSADGNWDQTFTKPVGLSGVLLTVQSDGKFLMGSIVGIRRYYPMAPWTGVLIPGSRSP